MFLFRQKTAYEMRISDWSADVCAPDLAELDLAGGERLEHGSRQFGETNALLDEPGGDTESLGEILGGRPAIDIVFERDAFVGRVHRHPLKIFGKARFGETFSSLRTSTCTA